MVSSQERGDCPDHRKGEGDRLVQVHGSKRLQNKAGQWPVLLPLQVPGHDISRNLNQEQENEWHHTRDD